MATNKRPDPVSSQGPLSKGPPLPKFPNNVDLVQDETNAELLQALLPALNKYKCLEVGPRKSRRSPFVRAFCDLYHPAGSWGPGKFSNVPDITSSQKYSFKSYKIPKIYETLQRQLMRGNVSSAVHLELHEALNEFYSKEQYYKDFLAACEPIAAVEANKPIAVRATFPTAMEIHEGTNVARLVVVAAPENPVNATTSATEPTLAPVETNHELVMDVGSKEKEPSVMSSASPTTSSKRKHATLSKRRKVKCSSVTPSPGVTSRRQRHTQRRHADSSESDEEDDEEAVEQAADPPARNTRRRLQKKVDDDSHVQSQASSLEDDTASVTEEKDRNWDEQRKQSPSAATDNQQESSDSSDTKEHENPTSPPVGGSAVAEGGATFGIKDDDDERSRGHVSSANAKPGAATSNGTNSEDKNDNSAGRDTVVKQEPAEGDKEVGEESSRSPTNDEATKRAIISRRAELAEMLQRRMDGGKDDNDPLCKKIAQKIDAEDEKLFELILLE